MTTSEVPTLQMRKLRDVNHFALVIEPGLEFGCVGLQSQLSIYTVSVLPYSVLHT